MKFTFTYGLRSNFPQMANYSAPFTEELFFPLLFRNF